MSDGTLVFDTAIDQSGFEKGAGKLKQTAEATGKDVGDIIKGILGASMVKAVINGVVEVGKAAIETASNLQEVQNVVDVTFGKGAAQIEHWAESARTQYGLTELQAKQYASTMGAMLKSMGMGEEKVLDMSTAMAGLAADMASFYNLDFDAAFAKIRAGISGETEPLKQLGINMSVASLEAFALARGITKSYEAMTQAEQATLRYNYLMQTTADAQGDFARTSDSYANSVRLLETNLATLAANIGGAILPIINDVLNAINRAMEGTETAADRIDDLADSARSSVSAVGSQAFVARELVKELEAMGDYAGMTAQRQQEWQSIARALVGVMPELSDAIDIQNGSFRNGTQAIYDHITALEAETKAQAFANTKANIIQTIVDAETKYLESMGDYEVAYKYFFNAQNARIAEEERLSQKYGISAKSLYKPTDAWGPEEYENVKVDDFDSAVYENDIAVLRELRAEEDALSASAVELWGNREALKQQAEEARTLGEERMSGLEAAVETLGLLGDAAAGEGGASNAVGALTDAMEGAGEAAGVSGRALERLREKGMAVADMLRELESYQLENLAQVRAELNGTFDLFERPGRVRRSSLRRDTNNLDAQAEYWERYKAAVDALQEREGGDAWVAELADGSEESLSKLEALATGSDEAYNKATAAKAEAEKQMNAAADSISESQLAVDAAAQEMLDAVLDATEQFNQETAAYDAGSKTAQGLAGGLASGIPSITQMVNQIVAQFERIGVAYPTLSAPPSPAIGPSLRFTFPGFPHAAGLDRVPYDNYPARLHEGEAVLTKAEASLWRAGNMPRAGGGAGAAGGSFQQVNNFNLPVQTPDEFAQTMRMYAIYGLEGVI